MEEPEEVVDLRDVDDEEKEEYEVDYDSEENEIDHGYLKACLVFFAR